MIWHCQCFLYFFFIFQDPINIPGKLQKHKAFVSEVNANESRIENVKSKGEDLIAANHYASPDIQQQIDDMMSQWTELQANADEKGNGSNYV